MYEWRKNMYDQNKNIDIAGNRLLKIIKKDNGKFLFNKLRDNQKYSKLYKLVMKRGKPKEYILDYYFKKWLYINKSLNQIDSANIIQIFCRYKLKEKISINKWKKLYLLLKSKKLKKNIKDILKLLKIYKGMKKLTKTIIKNKRRNIFNKLKTQKNIKKIKKYIIEIIDIIEYKKKEKLLKKYLLKWKNIIRQKNSKEETLEIMMNVLENKRIKNTVNNLTDLFLINKLLNDIPKIRALYFLRKIKKDGKYNKLYKIFSYDLVNTREDLLYKSKIPIINKILKIYAYKILSKLFNTLEKTQKKKNTIYIEDFFYKLYNNNIKKTKYKYEKQIHFEKMPNTTKGITFPIKKTPNMKRDEKDNKTIVYRRLAPFLVNYLNKKIKNIKNNVFDKIRYNNIGDQFCHLLKIFTRKTGIPDKEDLVDSLKYCIYMKLSKISISNKLEKLIRESIFRKIVNISKITGNLIQLEKLIKITMTHRNIAKDRWILYLIKRWRFISFVKKMAMKKMELMYKDLHVTYLEMAGNVLNENQPMGLYDRRFLPDIKMDKYLYDFNDPFLVEGSESYQCLKKKYIFKSLHAKKEKEKKTKTKYVKEIKTIEKTKEKIKDYYYYSSNDNIYNNNNETVIANNNNKSFKESKNINNIKLKESEYEKENKNIVNSSVVKNVIKEEKKDFDKEVKEKEIEKEKKNNVVNINANNNNTEKENNNINEEKLNNSKNFENYEIDDEYEEIEDEDEYLTFRKGYNFGNNNAIKSINDCNNNDNDNNKYIKSSYVYSSNIFGEISDA